MSDYRFIDELIDGYKKVSREGEGYSIIDKDGKTVLGPLGSWCSIPRVYRNKDGKLCAEVWVSNGQWMEYSSTYYIE